MSYLCGSAVGPIDENHRKRDTSQYRPREGVIDTVSFSTQVRIAKQSVHGIDVVFDGSAAPTVTTDMGQSELAAAEKHADHPHQRFNSSLITDDGAALQHSIQQSHSVFAVHQNNSDPLPQSLRRRRCSGQ